MSDLTGTAPQDNFGSLLNLGNLNTGLDGTLRTLTDGVNTSSIIQMSTTAFNVISGLELAGTPITATADEINGFVELNNQTDTTYTVVGTDVANLITLTNASDITVTLPQTSTETIGVGFTTGLLNIGSSTVTIAKEGADVLDGNTTLLPGEFAEITKRIAGTPNTYQVVGGSSLGIIQHVFSVETVANQTYQTFPRMNFAGTLINITTIARTGTCTATTSIEGTPVTATANAVSTTRTTQAVTGANTIAIGDDLTTVITANSTCLDMTIVYDITV